MLYHDELEIVIGLKGRGLLMYCFFFCFFFFGKFRVIFSHLLFHADTSKLYSFSSQF